MISRNDFYEYGDDPPKKKKASVRGWYFPAEIVALFYKGEIKPRDLVVLGIIDSWTKTYPNGITVGCFGSNKAIGKKACISAIQTSVIIRKLVALGVVRRYTKTDQKHNNIEQRYLVPVWRKVGKLRARPRK